MSNRADLTPSSHLYGILRRTTEETKPGDDLMGVEGIITGRGMMCGGGVCGFVCTPGNKARVVGAAKGCVKVGGVT